MKSKQLSRNLYIIATTIFIFAVGYYLYIEVYTKKKEAHIVATKSRILEQMSQNLQVKVKSMGSNTAEYVGYLLDLSKHEKSPENSFLSMLKQRKDIQYYNFNLEYVNSALPEKELKLPDDSAIKVRPDAMSDFLFYRLVLGQKYVKYNRKEIQFKTKYDLLMTDFMQRNIFNDYILIVDDTIIYSTLPGKPILVFNEQGNAKAKVDESGSGKETPVRSIELATHSKISLSAIRGVTTYDISISNNQYKLFICQMQVGKNTWSVCGLTKSEVINQAKKGLAPWVIILIFMVLSIIVLGLPFFKLKVMSPTEQLTSGNLLNSAISLFFGTSLIILFIFFGTNAYWNRSQNENRLKDLATQINDSLNNEIRSAWYQLDSYDKIELMSTNSGHSLTERSNLLIKNTLRPETYPYFDYTFWIDSTGMQKGLLTPFPKLDKPSNLSGRDYFKKPDEWVLPGKDTCRFRMESIVSITSGVVKVALSKRSQIDNLVIAMTGRFYSIIEPVIPQDYKFCIIDRNGLVWFHSDKLRNLQENFITECGDDQSLLGIIYANATRTLDLNYYDEPYRIHIKSLAPMPLYLVTMFNKQAEYAYQVQGLMLTLLLFTGLVMFIMMEILAMYTLNPFSRRSGFKNLIMDFIGAKKSHIRIYIVMTVLFVLVTILYLLLTNPINIVNPLLFALVMVSYIFPYLKYTISGFSFKSSGRNFFAFINIIFIFLINVSSLHYLSNNDLIKIDIFQGAIISLFIVSYILLQRGFTINYPACNITFYVCFLLGLLLVFSIATSIKFFEASVNHEIIRGIKRDQLNLASQRESRNLQLRNYYCLMEQNHQLNLSVKNVYEQRLERGIYSKFDSSTFYVKGKTFWKDIDKDSQNFIRAHKVRDYQGIESIINFFRPVYDRTSVETKYLESDSLLRGNQIWTICEKALVFDYLSDSEKYKSTKPDSCRIYTNLQRPDIFNPLSPVRSDIGWPLFNKYGIIFSLFLLVVLYGIFILIQFATRRMLGISILEMHSEYNFGNFIRERIASGHSVMVISSSFINVSDYVKENLKDSFDLTAIDFAKRDDIIANEKLTSEKDVLIIENFAFDYYSQSSLVMQMDMISEMIRQKKKMVITCINAPYFIEDYLYRKVKSIGDLKEKDKSDTVTVNWEQLQLSFNNILSNVNVLYTPEKYDQNTSHTDCYSKLKCDNKEINYAGDCGENLRCLICSELEVSTYLHRYSHEMMNFYDRLMELQIPRQIIKDRIIQRIMDLSRLYYDNILVTCTPMERFVLSDMAQDMIVNSKNQKVVNTLIHRGLFIINDCSIRFMNESFRKHVLLRFTSGEKARIKEELGDTGTSWQGYKIFLILIMIGLISFLFIANRAILDNLNKLFLVIGGGTVLISNLTGILTRKETDDTK